MYLIPSMRRWGSIRASNCSRRRAALLKSSIRVTSSKSFIPESSHSFSMQGLRQRCTIRLSVGLALCFLCSHSSSLSADKKEEKKKPEPPSIALVMPLAISPGLTNKVKIRGQNLTNVTDFRFANSNLQGQATIKSKANADVPKEMDAKKIGDTQLEVEVVFPPHTPAGTNSFRLVSPDGE